MHQIINVMAKNQLQQREEALRLADGELERENITLDPAQLERIHQINMTLFVENNQEDPEGYAHTVDRDLIHLFLGMFLLCTLSYVQECIT